MKRLRNLLDRIEPAFQPGARLEKFYALFEMVDTFLYSTGQKSLRAPHVRDAIDLKRMMSYVVLAVLPCLLVGWYNTGLQANLAIAQAGTEHLHWQAAALQALGVPLAADNLLACMVHGFLYFLPAYLVTLAVGGLWEVLFAIVRGHEVNEGFLVTSMLFVLTLPPAMPLWMVALGISFGVVFAKEIFGGTGKNFLNPALAGRAFLYFAYPAAISGDLVWVAGIDGISQATPLSLAASAGMTAIADSGLSWWQAFVGLMPGTLGETSKLCVLVGGAFLLYTRIASWRIVAGGVLGLVVATWLCNLFGSDANPLTAVPWHWHLVLGGFAFGIMFMATDPVSAAMTNLGRWIFGALVGVVTIVVRVLNPAFPEGIMLAILFANLFAPLIDHCVVLANIRRRERRHELA
ncbi:MAG: NADH:ubiquinone reductase (Na(+)-transporting) subunit B [Rhodocyclaceae bacterium]|nr:NADH:ubiquinone reductase (Na(+)-transporting) subunit B [Rhodocyclaceae bacterium]